MTEERLAAVVGVSDEGRRLDAFLSDCPGVASRSQAQQLIEEGVVTVDGRERAKNHVLKIGENVVYQPRVAKAVTVGPEPIPINVLFEDEHLLVVDKQAGLVVHPGPGNYDHTLVNALLARTTLANIGAPLRPGIVHRIDKETSGLIMVAKDDATYYALVDMIKARKVARKYLALVEGVFQDALGRIDAPIQRSPRNRKVMIVGRDAAKEAVTNFEVIDTVPGYSLLEVTLDTGRTHQIRAHMKFINHPVVGDPVYGSGASGKTTLDRQWLHAHRLEFKHPSTGEALVFASAPPSDLLAILDELGLRIPE